jgi:hypothetical protein|eukprot:SAG25_NODE_184_length_12440_cov_76.528968_1_plen_91_part_00
MDWRSGPPPGTGEASRSHVRSTESVPNETDLRRVVAIRGADEEDTLDDDVFRSSGSGWRLTMAVDDMVSSVPVLWCGGVGGRGPAAAGEE